MPGVPVSESRIIAVSRPEKPHPRRHDSAGGWGEHTQPNGLDKIVRCFEEENTFSDANLNSESAIDTDSEDEIDESATEVVDSDDDDWEDDDMEGDNNEKSSSSSVTDRPLFQRVDSKPNLTSRRSLLTDAFQKDVCPVAPGSAAPHSTPAIFHSRTSIPNDPSTGNSPQEGGLVMRRSKATRPKPIIMATDNVQPLVTSPKTTRRNMLESELTGSLRQNLLWERQQKNATTNAVAKRQQSAAKLPALRRAITTSDVKGLNSYQQQQQQPAKSGPFKDDSKPSHTYNQFFDSGLNDYHKSGW